ncbi:hypothetical protein G5C51_38655 [Streptomyces sp. A7024]|uniref:Uncharacterized protein n=1 Tax=Streptomyces coryli TaxID=1128680 RepID=A0A6G4UEB0_9ACTN|nr:hypothetical protein [Streptomyces coryli]NGN69798.1 hypothetical protein [Streptomyces coryli]
MPQDPVDRAPSMAQLLAANAAAEAVSTPPADEEEERAERPVAEERDAA